MKIRSKIILSFLSLILIPFLVLIGSLVLYETSIIKLPILEKVQQMDDSVVAIDSIILDNYYQIHRTPIMDTKIEPFNKGLFKRILFVDKTNIIQYDSSGRLVGTNYDNVAFFDSSNTIEKGKFYLNTSSSTTSYFSTIVEKGGLVYGKVIYLPDITLKDAMRTFLFLPFVMIGIFLLTILAMIFILSKILTSGILKPLKELNYAADMIANGDLDYEMTYFDDDDEIGKFCHEFDKMRLRLKNTLEKQVLYEQSRKQLIASVSHDLRTPLTSVIGYVEMLQDDVIQDEEMKKNYLEIINKKSKQLNLLIDDLFTFSKMELGEFTISPNLYNSKHLFESLLKDRDIDLKESNIKLIVEQPFPVCNVKVDEHRINQIIENLISNAKKFTNSYIKIYGRCTEHFLEIYVEDDGCGMPEESIPHIFEHFYKVDTSRTYSSKGSGLGLAICKQIVEAHGGAISVKSKLDVGTTFKVKIPKFKNPNNQFQDWD